MPQATVSAELSPRRSLSASLHGLSMPRCLTSCSWEARSVELHGCLGFGEMWCGLDPHRIIAQQPMSKAGEKRETYWGGKCLRQEAAWPLVIRTPRLGRGGTWRQHPSPGGWEWLVFSEVVTDGCIRIKPSSLQSAPLTLHCWITWGLGCSGKGHGVVSCGGLS